MLKQTKIANINVFDEYTSLVKIACYHFAFDVDIEIINFDQWDLTR